MNIQIIQEKATAQQLAEMAEEYESQIKLAVDVELGILAGGGEWHADCEEMLLAAGSSQENIWGADWFPQTQRVGFDSLINIRPSQGNFRTELQDPSLRSKIEAIVRNLMEVQA
jgi:hypothetical protein